MLYNKTKNRLSIFLAISVISIGVIIFIIKTLEDNVLYFYSPSDIKKNNEITFENKIKVGGMVKKGSIKTSKNEIKFIITDFKNEIIVSYKGTVPALFAEGKGVVAEGKLEDKKFFLAKRILAKHDENYMPPEIKESMKKNAK
mgnify:FL=1|tara:strand:+ start:6475 stop:6903 length:429 start_codon:yes stop_codon:yes gene_type:complete